MIRRLFCFFCAALILCMSFPAATFAAKAAPVVYCYDFDLAFSLNVDAFSLQDREKLSGYADLLGSLGLKGRIAWCPKRKSMDLDATLYYIDKPSLSYPFRVYGTKKRLFVTSPLIDNEELFFDLSGMMEFAVKAKNTLNMPLPYFAFLYPYCTEYAFRKLTSSWNKRIGISRTTGTVTMEQFETLSARWSDLISGNAHLQRWIFALMGISEAPAVIDSEFANLPRYYEIVTGGQPLSVSVSDNSEIWQDSLGNTLFSRIESANGLSVNLSLPASENGYVPAFSLRTDADEQTSSFSISASVEMDPAYTGNMYLEGYEEDFGPVTDNGDATEFYEEVIEDGEDYEYAEGDDYQLRILKPAQLLSIRAAGSGFPVKLPADSDFSASASILGAAYPNYAFLLKGATKKDGAFSLSLCKPGSADAEPAGFFSVTGTVVPAEPDQIPDYRKKSLKNVTNIFAMNDETLAEFSDRMIPLAVKSLLTFVAEAPTSACQSLLDDLTDLGVLGMILH